MDEPTVNELNIMAKNLIFVPRTDNREIMVTGLDAGNITFKTLCMICADKTRAKPLECTFIVHNPTGDMRYMYLNAKDAAAARDICARRISDWAQQVKAG